MTDYTTLLSPQDLRPHLEAPDWAIVDCRFAIRDPGVGRTAYLACHIPGAVYAHIGEDLSGPVVPGKTGRHPLPSPERLAERLSGWGIDSATQVAAYDDSGGSMAVSLWWLLRWLGHRRAALVDGGWQAWQAAGYPTRPGAESRTPRRFVPWVRAEHVVDAATVTEIRTDAAWRLFDSRAADRYRGENETIDPVAGHIPGAISAPFAENLGPDGRFRSADELRRRFGELLNGAPADHAVFYCGSGITAAHNVLAVAHAGLGDARLYRGSWSDWITDSSRPVARGPDNRQTVSTSRG
ncbi:MAG: sulfurtransferase [Gemmatimonadetes bacterium]|nr:sulfurtransferase [Gemmatimonadota bacterium]